MSNKLILFFNGWSLDENVISHLKVPEGFDFMHINKYQDYDIIQLEQKIKDYEEIHLIGFSIGVWFANELISATNFNFKSKIAVNGSSNTIDDNYGIPKQIFKTTLDNLSKDSLKEFDEVCCPEVEIKRDREFVDCYEELQFFYDYYKPQRNLFTHALISKKDRIFPVRNLMTQYATIDFKRIDGPHIPFNQFTSWEEILKQGES